MYKAMRAPSMYAQDPDVLLHFHEICKGYGSRFLFVCSRSGRAAVEPKVTASLEGTDTYARFETFGGISSEGEIARMEMKIDGAFAGTVAADGLIISTPTGSTAYSLSAGGCVLAPDCGTFLITPVCSFSLNSRPVVFSDDSELTVRTGSEMSVVEDGSQQGETIIGDEITVRKASRKVCFLAREKSGFYRKLAQKISEL